MKNLLILFFLFPGIFATKQTTNYDSFEHYVLKNYDFPESVKKSCDWNFMIVKVFTNSNNKIVKFECLNPVDQEEKKRLDILLKYTFPKNVHLNNHPLIFFLSLDNSEVCDTTLPHRFQSPNEGIRTFSDYIGGELKKDPKVNIIWDTLLKIYYAPQR